MPDLPLSPAVPVSKGFRLDPTCSACTPAEHESDPIVTTTHWKVVLHPDQTVPGACLISSKRHVPKLGALSSDEQAELLPLIAAVESALEQALGATLVNFECLRNWAYRAEAPEPPFLDGRPNPHVHWHVAPRYADVVEVAGERFEDPCFGERMRWSNRPAPEPVRHELVTRLRAALVSEA